jgi:copper chaperone CopZ
VVWKEQHFARMSTYEWNIGMTCGGCESAVKKILSKVEGLEVVTSVEDKKLFVS